MLNWLFSRPLQIKFFFSTILLVSAVLLVLMLNVLQVLNPFLSHHIEQDMQERTHILAMTLMDGPAAHNQEDLQQLLQDVSENARLLLSLRAEYRRQIAGFCRKCRRQTRGHFRPVPG